MHAEKRIEHYTYDRMMSESDGQQGLVEPQSKSQMQRNGCATM